jgi:hypothetical protein
VPELETLFGLAEIAIGMAGFSAIVVLFKRRDSGKWQPSDADRFNGMLIHAMAAALFCVLPAVVHAVPVREATVWTVSSAVLGLQIAAHATLIARLPSTGGSTRAVVVGGGLVAVAFQIGNAADWGLERGFAPYLVGVLWHLLHAGTLFVMLIWVRREDVEPA